MSDRSKIEWTEATWNPLRGCTRVSRGCEHCYAERMAARNLPGHRSLTTGEPFAIMSTSGPRWTGRVELIESQMEIPLHWRRPRRIFVNSMSDTFHETMPDSANDLIYAVMALCPQHVFMVPTKRPKRRLEYFNRLEAIAEHWQRKLDEKGSTRPNGSKFNASSVLNIKWLHAGAGRAFPDSPWPLPNVWEGVSVEDQATADERIPLLLQTPAAVRFLSVEPLIGPVELDADWLYPRCRLCGRHGLRGNRTCDFWDCGHAQVGRPLIDWVIVGGESGPGARPVHPDWVRSIRDQCIAAGVAFFFKQWGEWAPAETISGKIIEAANVSSETGEWESRRTRWPICCDMIRIGKRSAGRLLDGRKWSQIPEVRW